MKVAMSFFNKIKESVPWRPKTEKEIITELNDPATEELSNKFFDLSVETTALAIGEGGEQGEFREEYLAKKGEYEDLLQNQGSRIALYSTRKFIKFRENNCWWSHHNHWRSIFFRPNHIAEIAPMLVSSEIGVLAIEARKLIEENIKDLESNKRIRSGFPNDRYTLRPPWYRIERVKQGMEALKALREFLQGRDVEEAQRLINRCRDALD